MIPGGFNVTPHLAPSRMGSGWFSNCHAVLSLICHTADYSDTNQDWDCFEMKHWVSSKPAQYYYSALRINHLHYGIIFACTPVAMKCNGIFRGLMKLTIILMIAFAHPVIADVPIGSLVMDRSNGGAVNIQHAGEPDTLYRLEASENWGAWHPLSYFHTSNGQWTHLDQEASSYNNRFYRVVKPPANLSSWTNSNVGDFCGPFANWADVKRDFGAVGDGIHDDTGAIQNAMESMRPASAAPALYFPKGVYRITRTLVLARDSASESMDVMLVGEDPATTSLLWDGEAGGVMLEFGAWFSRMGRLTLDGAGKAGTAISHGPHFASYNEYFDLVLCNAAVGIEGGRMKEGGIAETVVARCKFLNCTEIAISIQNWNSLDWFIWNCSFDRCGLGVSNEHGAGNFHVYNSSFKESTKADMSIGNTCYFSVRGNISEGSRAFFIAAAMPACGMLTLQGNSISKTIEAPVQVGNLGPLILFDNRMDTDNKAAVRVSEWTAVVSAGNVYSCAKPIQGADSPMILDDRSTRDALAALPFANLPPTPSASFRPCIDLPSDADSAQIQTAIDNASKWIGQRPVIHLAAGIHSIKETLVIPAGSDLQLLGDGGKTRLVWSGQDNGLMLRMRGPATAALSEFTLDGANKASGIQLGNVDQPNARIFMDQAFLMGAQENNLLVQDLKHAEVRLDNFYHSGSPSSLKVSGKGLGEISPSTQSQVVLFGGAASNNGFSYDVENGGQLLVSDVWYETSDPKLPRFLRGAGSGRITLQGANIAPMYSRLDAATLDLSQYSGQCTLINTIFTFPETCLQAPDDTNTSSQLLLLGHLGTQKPALENKPRASLLDGFETLDGGSARPRKNMSQPLPDGISRMLAQSRSASPAWSSPPPAGATDIRFFRLQSKNMRSGIRILP